MNTYFKYAFVFCALVANSSGAHGQTDTTWNIEKWRQDYHKNWGGVNDSLKTKLDFFMEYKSWGMATDFSTALKSNSNFVSTRYFIADFNSPSAFAWLIETSAAYNFNKVFKGSMSYSLGHSKMIPFMLGINLDYFRYKNTSVFYLAPLIRFEGEFVALEYSRRFLLSRNSHSWGYPNNFALIIRPRLFFDAYQGGQYSQYWYNSNLAEKRLKQYKKRSKK